MPEQDSYQKLKNLVENDKLRIVYIDAVPRSVSTALEIALTEGADGQVNEPFFVRPRNFEAGCKAVYDRAVGLGANEKKVTLIVKELANHLRDEEMESIDESWEKWMEITDSFVSVSRQPLQQLNSFMTRLINDRWKDKGGDNLTEDEVKSKFPNVAKTLSKGINKFGLYIPGDFEATSWHTFGEHLDTLEQHLQSNPHKKFVAVDSFLIRAAPEIIMPKIADALGLEHSEAMINGWTKATGNNFHHPHLHDTQVDENGAFTNYWINKAVTSTSFSQPSGKTIPMEEFPEECQAHLTDAAIPAYMKVLALSYEQATAPQSLLELKEILDKKVNGKALVDIDPVSSYALVTAFPNDGPIQGQAKDSLLKTISRKNPEHQKSFDAINSAVSLAPSPEAITFYDAGRSVY